MESGADNRSVEDERAGSDRVPLDHAVYTCRSCGTTVLGTRSFVTTLSCCGNPLRTVTLPGLETTEPTVETVANEVFDLPKNGFDICRYTIEEGAVTVASAATAFDVDRSVISRYLNRLATAGFLEKTARIRRGGGAVNVYYPVAPDEVERDAIVSLYMWTVAAAELVHQSDWWIDVGQNGSELMETRLDAVVWD